MRVVIKSTEAEPRICLVIEACDILVNYGTAYITVTDHWLETLREAVKKMPELPPGHPLRS